MNEFCVATRRYLYGALLSAAVSGASAAVETWHTPNGVPVYYAAAAEIPMIDVQVIFAAGSAHDGVLPGLAHFTAGLLKEGTGELSTDAFLTQLGATGARMYAGVSRDSASVSLRSMLAPAHFKPAWALFVQAISDPRFDAAAITRRREQQRLALQARNEKPGSIAAVRFYAELYGSHPYATPVRGTLSSLAAIERADIKAFYRRYYVAANAAIAIVGALSREHARKIAAELAAALVTGAPAPPIPPFKRRAAAQRVHVDFTSAQTHVWLGQHGISHHHPDYFPVLVANHILGAGPLTSLLFERLREQRGLAYRVRASCSPLAAGGPFVITLQTASEQLSEAYVEASRVLRAFIRRGPTTAQLEAAKKYLIGSLPLQLDSNREQIEHLAALARYGLPLNYAETFAAHIAAVQRQDVQRAFAALIDPSRMLTVTVGVSDPDSPHSRRSDAASP